MQDHPLSDDLTKLTQEELDKKYGELMFRWHAARRMNMNPAILYQLELLLQGYEYEKQRRVRPQDDGNPVVLDTDGEYKK